MIQSIIISGDCINSIEGKINVGLKHIKSCLNDNSLRINFDKSSFLQYKINSNHIIQSSINLCYMIVFVHLFLIIVVVALLLRRQTQSNI